MVCCVEGPTSKDSHRLNPHTPTQTHKPLHLPEQHNSSIEGGRELSLWAPTVPHKDHHKNLLVIYSLDSRRKSPSGYRVKYYIYWHASSVLYTLYELQKEQKILNTWSKFGNLYLYTRRLKNIFAVRHSLPLCSLPHRHLGFADKNENSLLSRMFPNRPRSYQHLCQTDEEMEKEREEKS